MRLSPRFVLMDSTNPVHLYRHLLRETSYLPPVARLAVEARIKYRFRRHSNLPISAVRQRFHRRRNANSALRVLRAAVSGDWDCMQKVLMLVFGRLGKRRRELMDELLRKTQQPVNLQEVDEQIARSEKLPVKRESKSVRRVSSIMDKWNLKLLEALGNSQAKANDNIAKRFKIERTKKLDDKNQFGKIRSQRKMRRLEARWWKWLAGKILPPLGESEWEMMGRLARGEHRNAEEAKLLKMARQRRKPAKQKHEEENGHGGREGRWVWENAARTPVSLLEKQRGRHYQLRSGLRAKNTGLSGDRTPIGYHHLTARCLRRLMLSVWCATPKIVYREGPRHPDKFNIVWGGITPRQNAPRPRLDQVRENFFSSLPPQPEAGLGKKLKNKKSIVKQEGPSNQEDQKCVGSKSPLGQKMASYGRLPNQRENNRQKNLKPSKVDTW